MSSYILVSANYPPHVGGVDRYSQKVAHELARRGNRVVVITSSLEGQSDYERVNDHLEIFRLPSIWFLGDRMPVLRQTKQWREVRQMLCGIENPRMIIQTFLYPLSYAAARLARQKKWPFIVINHGCNYVCQGGGLVDWAEHLYEEFLARAVTHKSQGCYAVSKAAGEWVEHFGVEFAGVLYNGIEAETIIKKLDKLPGGIREQYGISPETTLVAFVGRMIPEKGIAQLAHAVRQHIDEGKDIALIAVGDGEMIHKLYGDAGSGIAFCGGMEHDDVLRVLRESDCCCLPSDSEGFGMVLIEAALCRCFMIGSPFGGTKEAIGEYGIIMKGNSQQDIYEALSGFMSKEDKALELERSFQRARTFTWENTCECIENLSWKH